MTLFVAPLDTFGMTDTPGIERLRDPPTEWSRQFDALGLNPE